MLTLKSSIMVKYNNKVTYQGCFLNKGAAGCLFIFLAALFICTKFISAAIYSSSEASWSSGTFNDQLHEIGTTLNILNIVSLVIGIVYLYFAERDKQ